MATEVIMPKAGIEKRFGKSNFFVNLKLDRKYEM